MSEHRFRIVNVFTVGADRFSGNPLCVFEQADGMTPAQMQALARQFNLSETTFLLPPSASAAVARVRIFTPTLELPFAGHPTLGSAHVVRALRSSNPSDRVVLELPIGLVEVNAESNRWTLRAARPPDSREVKASVAELAAMVGLTESSIAGPVRWVNTGYEQLVMPLATPDDVRALKPNAELLMRHAYSDNQREAMVYAWARDGAEQVVARFFYCAYSGVSEDPATGSACANLGGWMLATGQPLPVRLRVYQGAQIERPSLLELRVDADRNIFVSGTVIEIGRGSVSL